MGAKHVTFVENYSQVLPILKKNILNLKTKKNFKIIEQDISDDLIFNHVTFCIPTNIEATPSPIIALRPL